MAPPSCLITYGEHNVDAIEDSGLDGKYIFLKNAPIFIIGGSPSWKSTVTIAMTRLNRKATIRDIYAMVELVAPDKVMKNKNYKAKIRQKVQQEFKRINRGTYSYDN